MIGTDNKLICNDPTIVPELRKSMMRFLAAFVFRDFFSVKVTEIVCDDEKPPLHEVRPQT